MSQVAFCADKDDIFQSSLPPASLPHTLASLKEEEDDTPNYITDKIINNVVIDDFAESLFATESNAASRSSSVIGSFHQLKRER